MAHAEIPTFNRDHFQDAGVQIEIKVREDQIPAGRKTIFLDSVTVP